MQERKLAMFDFDKTIYNKHSLFGVIQFYEDKGVFENGVMDRVQKIANRFDPTEGKFRNTANEILKVMSEALTGLSYKKVKQATHDFFALNKDNFYSYFSQIVPLLKQSHDIWLVTQNSQMVAEVIKEKFGLTGYLSTSFEVLDGKFTGKILNSFANGKQRAMSLVEKYGKKASIAVGDSENDIQMLELVEIPVCFNPNEELEKVAKGRNWTIINNENAKEIILDLVELEEK